MKKNEKNQSEEKRIELLVRYQESVAPIKVNLNESVTALLQAAIIATENQSVPKERFQIKLDGLVLDPKGKLSDYSLSEGSKLLLVLIAGGGGSN